MRIAARPLQKVPPHQQVPSRCTLRITSAVVASSPNATSTWLSTTSLRISHPDSRSRSANRRAWRQLCSTSSSTPSRPSDAIAAQILDPAHAAARLRRELVRIAAGPVGEIVRLHRHRAAERAGVAHDGETAVVGHVEPLVGVGRPRVGVLDTGGEPAEPARRSRPQAERSVHVDPDVAGADRVAHRAHRIEGTGVHVPGLSAHDRRPPEARQGVRAHPAFGVDRHAQDPVAPEPEHSERLEQRGMGLLARHHGDRRRFAEPVPVDVVTVREQHRAPGRGERGEIRHGRAGDERGSRVRGQVQSLQHPPHRDPLQRGADRRAHLAEGILIPRRREPACGQRRGQRAAGDEAEVARTGARDHPLAADLVEPREDLRCRQPLVRQPSIQGRHELVGVAGRRDAAFGE